MGNWLGFPVRQRAEAPALDLSQLEAAEERSPSPAAGPVGTEKFGAGLAPVLQHHGITKADAEMIKRIIEGNAALLITKTMGLPQGVMSSVAVELATACAALNHLACNDGRAAAAEVRDAA